MEQFNDRQMEVFCAFYRDCVAKGINPAKSKADKQRVLLLAQNNTDLVKILGDTLESRYLDVFQIGKECAQEQDSAKQWDVDRAEILKNRQIDEQAAALEKELSTRRGREKRSFFYYKTSARLAQEIREATEGLNEISKITASQLERLERPNDSWGILGGIAAGITGSSTVGAAVASDAMRRDTANNSVNSTLAQAHRKMYASIYDITQKQIIRARKSQNKVLELVEEVKVHLVENPPVAELMDGLALSDPEIAFTNGHTMLIKVEVAPKRGYQIADDVPAVIDGCFMAEVYHGNDKIGCAYLNFPRDGADKATTLKGHCLEAKVGETYTVSIVPVALWLIEKNTSEQVKDNILDLNALVPTYNIQWLSISIQNFAWIEKLKIQAKRAKEEQAIAERKAAEAKAEAEHRAAEAKAAAAEQAKKTKKIAMIATPIVIVAIMAIGAGIVLNAKQKEAARLDAYNAAVALAESGQYDEAIAAFMELEDYKDSAELVTQIQAEVDCQEQYDRAISQMNAGDFERAIKSFQKLGDYKDSVTLVEKASEELYTAALDYYRSGKPISLPIAWNNFNKYPSDYKDTQQFKDEIDGILKQLAGRYIKRGGDSSADENFVVILYDDGDGFDIDYSSLSSYKYFNYLTTTIAWLIEDGQAVYGNIGLKQGELTVTLVDGGIYIDTDVHEELNGTYLKQ